MQKIPFANLHMVRQALEDFPRPDKLAYDTLAQWLTEQAVKEPPEQIVVTTLHYQLEPLGEGRRQFRENAVVSQQTSLVEALLSNWQGETAAGYSGFHYGDWAGIPPSGPVRLVERLESAEAFSNANAYAIFNGLYRRNEPARYAPDTLLPIRAEKLQAFIWNLHFHNTFKASLDLYWDKRQKHYQRALKIAFIAACNKQVMDASLSSQARQWVWEAAGLLPGDGCQRRLLNVYGYVSTDIVEIRHTASDKVVLYIPGNSSPFHEFINASAMKSWLASQCQIPDKRAALQNRFARADLPDGLEFSGLATTLEGLGLYPLPHRLPDSHPGFATSGIWDPQQVIDYNPQHYSPWLEGDLFEYLTLRQKQRAYADADTLIISNHQINKARWSSYLNLAVNLLTPFALVLPQLVPLLVVGGLTEFGLGLDRTINGRSLEDKASGLYEQAFGLFNAASNGAAGLGRIAEVFRYSRPGFFASRRLAALLEEPVGAAVPSPEQTLQPAELAFREQAVESPASAEAFVTRIDENLQHRFMAWLQTDEGIIAEWVHYEFSSDSFIRATDVRLADPPRWEMPQEPGNGLVLSDRLRRPTNSQRVKTLRALGIRLQLPINLESLASLQRTAIPKVFTSIWVGDKAIAGPFLEALSHNARVLRNSGYRFQILLSQQTRSAYVNNLRTLGNQAEGALLMPLEGQAFFQRFRESPYFAQYQSALQGRNYASACDILRYRVLQAHGGVYMDADDRLLLPAVAEPEQPLRPLELKTSPDGLLLSAPVSNDQLGMYIKYNNSLIGSHPGNPTLDAISDEILRRYQTATDFYHSRPDPRLQPLPFQAYARRLSLLTGPGVLNDVIDVQLPWLGQLRELCSLLVSPVYDVPAVLDLSSFRTTMRQYVPLDQIAEMGEAHSWAEPAQR